jgi:hypothetical protein
MQRSDPQFQALPSTQLGQNWCVKVVWASGDTETLSGFANQYSALEWIRLKSANWVVDKIMQRPSEP